MNWINRAVWVFALLTFVGCANVQQGGRSVVQLDRPFRDGTALASPAINRAIETTAAAGGGTVVIPAGRYRCYSIRLKSNVSLYLDPGCVIVAAKRTDIEGYDDAEPCEWSAYQDFGHSHWHNSMIWGEGLSNVSILGPGLIDGSNLSNGGADRVEKGPTSTPSYIEADPRDVISPTPKEQTGPPIAWPRHPTSDALKPHVGNKAIALKNCHNVMLRDFSVLKGGHFAILVTGVDNLTIDNLLIDTNRDGMDIDCCQNVKVSNCSVNSPNDDGICPKSSFALGYRRSTENLAITNCYVTGGYRIGTMLDGTFERFGYQERQSHTGRIKFGTESNGGFRRIAVSNCVFEYCGGLAIESEDGAIVEDIAISNLTMRDIVNSPIFIRLGNRARGPQSPPPGIIRRIVIDNIVASNCKWRYGSIISGVPGHPIEDVSISNIRIQQEGGGTAEEAKLDPPERERRYPDPHMFGTMPAYGFFVRHVSDFSLNHAKITTVRPDERPFAALWDVGNAEFDHVQTSNSKDSRLESIFSLKGVGNLTLRRALGLPDQTLANPGSPTYEPVVEEPDPLLDKRF